MKQQSQRWTGLTQNLLKSGGKGLHVNSLVTMVGFLAHIIRPPYSTKMVFLVKFEVLTVMLPNIQIL
jgi:hypothetical protein